MDQRVTRLEEALEPLPAEVAKVATAVEHIAEEVQTLRKESREDSQGIRKGLSDLHRLLLQLAGGLAFCLIAAIVTVIVA